MASNGGLFEQPSVSKSAVWVQAWEESLLKAKYGAHAEYMNSFRVQLQGVIGSTDEYVGSGENGRILGVKGLIESVNLF